MNTVLGSPTNFDTLLTDNDRNHYGYICKLLTKMKINKVADIKRSHPNDPNIKLDYLSYFKRFSVDELRLLTQKTNKLLWEQFPYTEVQGSWNTFSRTYLSA